MITKNPYKYKGALDPVKDQLVCISRRSDLNRVIAGIDNGEYWNILGSRQVGKSTFLRQIQNHSINAYPFYLSFDVSPKNDEKFYQWVIDKIREGIPAKKKRIKIDEKLEPKNRFLDFLEKFQPREDKKIIFLFDEIEGILFLKDFLDLCRSIHENRYDKKPLERYAIITAGSTDLVALTVGQTSPYDVAENLYLNDFSNKESEILIKNPFEQLGIVIEPKAKQELISQLSGHPQMLQHACSKLVDIALKQEKWISEKDVADVLYLLTKENTTLSLLKTDLEKNSKLQNLVTYILKEVANPFSRNWFFSIAGAGSIVEDENKCCRIRNQVFKRVIEDFLEDPILTETITLPIQGQDTEFSQLPTNKYHIIGKIGEGGMGIVYKARDQVLPRFVAVKVLKQKLAQNKKIRDKFYREAQITAQLQHPKIVTIYNVWKSKNSYAIIMEFIHGKSFKEILASGTVFSYVHVLYIAKELLEALDHAHNHNERIIHRDIKPGNIMLNTRGEIKVLDFGLAVIRNVCKDEKTSAIIGTLNYMSPEQARKEMVDERSDIYSCGATMFHLVTATVPFKLEIIDHPFLVNFMKNEVKKHIPDELIEIIAKCMQIKKEKRFQSARELLEKIKEVEMAILKRPTTKDDIKDIIPKATGNTTSIPYTLIPNGQ